MIFEMSQLACRVAINDVSFDYYNDDYNDDYGATRFLKRYMTDNNNTVDIK